MAELGGGGEDLGRRIADREDVGRPRDNGVKLVVDLPDAAQIGAVVTLKGQGHDGVEALARALEVPVLVGEVHGVIRLGAADALGRPDLTARQHGQQDQARVDDAEAVPVALERTHDDQPWRQQGIVLGEVGKGGACPREEGGEGATGRLPLDPANFAIQFKSEPTLHRTLTASSRTWIRWDIAFPSKRVF